MLSSVGGLKTTDGSRFSGVIMNIREQIAEINEVVFLLEEDFDSAIIGVNEKYGSPPCIAYDRDKVIEILMQDMSREEAFEYFECNILGAWMGGYTPCFITILNGDL